MVYEEVVLPLSNIRLADKLLTNYIHFYAFADPTPGNIAEIGCLISVLGKLDTSLSRSIHGARLSIKTCKSRHESSTVAPIN